MNAKDLEYKNLLSVIKPFTDKGRPISIGFLNWFLEHIYRLDQVTAEDVICDKNNDRGIDGLYVDNERLEIHFFQSKTKQAGTIGDKDLREFSGTLNQIRTVDALQTFLKGKVDQEIKDKLTTLNAVELLRKGYSVRGVFVTNVPLDANGKDVVKNDSALVVFDQAAIAEAFVDLNIEGGIKGEYEFRSDGQPLIHQAEANSRVVVIFAEGTQLAKMPGIADGSLFELNVRLPLGSTKVNKAIRDSVENQHQHQKFALFHNGVTILAEKVTVDGDLVSIKNFVVVNGAQSLKQFHSAANKITSDLKIIARIIEIGADKDLAREISINSNNQNGIKPRDLRSNDTLQVRLQAEFAALNFEGFAFDVKRGENAGDHAISNELAGKLLLAFDLVEPWSCHQTYKVFDEKYTDIFARPGVNAQRIIFLYKIMELIDKHLDSLANRPFAHYALTRYVLLTGVRRLLEQEATGRDLLLDPKSIFDTGQLPCVLSVIDELLTSMMIDVNHELQNGQMADYKSELKTRGNVEKFLNEIIRSYQKDKARGKVGDINARLATCKESKESK